MEPAARANHRRRVPRISVDLPVTLTWKRKNFPCQARQLSEFGILLASEHKELVGQDIRLKLDLDSPSRSLSLDRDFIDGRPETTRITRRSPRTTDAVRL